MLNLADDLSGGELILSRGGRPGDTDESSDLSDFPIQLTMQKKMGDHPPAGVVVARLLEKGKSRLQDGQMFGRPQPGWNLRLVDPLIERFAILGHEQYLLDCDTADPVAEV